MSSGEPQQGQTAAIRDEVRRTIQQLNEMAQTEPSFDTFCDTVLSKVVKITGAHGAQLWQVNGDKTPKLTHRTGTYPSRFAQSIAEGAIPQHASAVMEVVSKQQPMGLASEAFNDIAPQTENDARDQSFLMLFSPVYNRAKKCCGTLELLQRGDISPAAQEGYLRFLTQISQLFQRWHEQQDLKKLSTNAGQWNDKLDFITEVHRSIDPTETAFAVANEARRLLNCDRASVAKWNGSKCKVIAISSQDRFDNRANVVRKLGKVATSSVSADTTFWVVGSTEGIAPDVADQINDYLDEAHSRTLVVVPIVARPPEAPDLEMRSKRKEKARKLGALILEYFDTDVQQEAIADKYDLIVQQSELALENSRQHSEILMLPVWKRIGWLQNFLFRDHFAKTMTGLAALALLTLLMIFFPKELKMKVEGVMHPTERRTVFSPIDGEIVEVPIVERMDVAEGDLLLVLENTQLERQMLDFQTDIDSTEEQVTLLRNQLSSPEYSEREREEIGGNYKLMLVRSENLKSQLRLMEEKKKLLRISSPMSGTVINSQPDKKLMGVMATPNMAVLEIANFKGPWQLELKIPQNKIGYIDEILRDEPNERPMVEFRIGTNPNLVLKGKLLSVSRRAVQSEDGIPVFEAIVEADSEKFEELTDELRSGVGVTAKIHCGKRSLGFVCFYQIYDWFRTKVFF